LSEVLQDLGLEVKLANPSKVKIIPESLIKTDKVDAGALAQLLRTNFLPDCYLAPRELREARDLLRYWITLIHLRTGLENRVHALLTRLGIYHSYSDLFGKKGRSFSSSLELSLIHRQALDGYLRLIDTSNKLIRQPEEKIRKVVKESEEGQFLISLPGIGFFLVYLVLVEIGEIGRFPSEKRLCSYAGLAPPVYQSGTGNYHGHIDPKCNRYLQWGMIEAAQRAKRTHRFLRSCAEKIARQKSFPVEQQQSPGEVVDLARVQSLT